jgi:hypothetical protein
VARTNKLLRDDYQPMLDSLSSSFADFETVRERPSG